ncbi:MAG TPA: hypothetical protein VGW38_00560 [Chloroflexota bacterium]|nr:hypothetical protein [Chloroflexota bacterium]
MSADTLLEVSAGRDDGGGQESLPEARVWLSDSDGQAVTVNLQCCGTEVQGEHLASSGHGHIMCPDCGLWYLVEVEVRVTAHAIPSD